jgi:aquaporin Z
MLQKLLAEFLGTFFFLAVILATGEAIPIAIALGAAIFMTAKVSGGNLNPAVSTMLFAKGDLDAATYIGYIVAQVLGGLAALLFYTATLAA